jgi:hypothetical protein
VLVCARRVRWHPRPRRHDVVRRVRTEPHVFVSARAKDRRLAVVASTAKRTRRAPRNSFSQFHMGQEANAGVTPAMKPTPMPTQFRMRCATILASIFRNGRTVNLWSFLLIFFLGMLRGSACVVCGSALSAGAPGP